MNDNFTETTAGIRVTVQPEPLQQESDPDRGVFAFAYTVILENLGSVTVQLLDRHWVIRSAGAQIAEVVGPGVVGQQPILKSGERFEYTSSAVIHDPIGTMEGSYSFMLLDGAGSESKRFEVKIPRFNLLYPVIIH